MLGMVKCIIMGRACQQPLHTGRACAQSSSALGVHAAQKLHSLRQRRSAMRAAFSLCSGCMHGILHSTGRPACERASLHLLLVWQQVVAKEGFTASVKQLAAAAKK